jgi:uridine kinase
MPPVTQPLGKTSGDGEHMHFRRIAVSGSAGIGKTTLCHSLSDVLGHVLI